MSAKDAEPIGYIYSNNGVKVGAINRYDVPNGTPLYTHPPKSRVAEPAPHLTDAETEKLRAEAAAYKWAYEYLQSRMNSIDRNGWAHDCDGEIEYRIAAKVRGTT